MEVGKQLKFKSYERLQVGFISNNVDVMTHDRLSSVALALDVVSTVDEAKTLKKNSTLSKLNTYATGRIMDSFCSMNLC